MSNPVNLFLKDIAASGLTVRVQGTCMDSSIPDGSRVRIRQSRFPLPGDVVVVPGEDRLLVHRVIGAYRRNGAWKILTRADRGARPDMAVPASAVIGKVVSTDGRPLRVPVGTRLLAFTRFLRFALVGYAR